MGNKILLILDLDETLIHASENRLSHEPDFHCFSYHVYKRPFVEEFIQNCAGYFNLGVWSSAGNDYVEKIVEEIFPPSLNLKIVWGRSKCTHVLNQETLEYQYRKDLKKLKRKGFPLSRILIVDNDRHKVSRNYGNAVYVKDFLGDPADRELLFLMDYLKRLSHSDDVRTIEKRNWRSGIDHNPTDIGGSWSI